MGHAVDTEIVTEETLSSMPQFIQAVGQVLPISKKGYAALVLDLASALQVARREAEATKVKLTERVPNLSELGVKLNCYLRRIGVPVI